MTDEEIQSLFVPLYSDFADLQWLIDNKPLLAHYTSLDTLEKILRSEEIWFSNPLFMNDVQEIRFGILEGVRLFDQSSEISEICGSQKRFDHLVHAFLWYFSQFEKEHALDTYVFCLSEHDPKNKDGILSMWRGYGGQGTGAALVFNTSFITPNADSPILIIKVSYESTENRLLWLKNKFHQWCNVLRASTIPDDKLYLAAHQLFNLIKIFALKFKHDGFLEEREWRVIYLPERDLQGILKNRFDYVIGSRGVEPKLKYKIEPLPVDPQGTWTFETILDRIILGPSVSSPLAQQCIERMLYKMGKDNFRQKICASSIPLRST